MTQRENFSSSATNSHVCALRSLANTTGAAISENQINERIEFLRNELLKFKTEARNREGERKIHIPTASVKAPVPGGLGQYAATGSSWNLVREFRARLSWLTEKVKLSRCFPLFQLATKESAHTLVGNRNTLWERYLRALGVDSMESIRKALNECSLLEDETPCGIRQYFPPLAELTAYFLKVEECLDALSGQGVANHRTNAPARSVFSRDSFISGLLHKSSVTGEGALLKSCVLLGEQLDTIIAEAAERLNIALSLASALKQDTPQKDTNTFCTRAQGTRVGALNSFISATPV